MLQHVMIYMYKLDIDTWQNQQVNEAKNKKFQQYEQKQLRDNSIVVYGINQ